MAGVNFGNIQYFDGLTSGSGLLVLGTSGNTANQGSAIIHLQSVDFDFKNDTTDLQSFDSSFQVARAITSQSFEISAEGYFTSSTENGYSGSTFSTYVASNGQHNGEEILAISVQRRTDLKTILKVGTKVLRGNVIISNFKVSGKVNEVITYSFTLMSNGPLTVLS